MDNYPNQIAEYYEIAPKIVREIDQTENSKEIYLGIWDEFLSPCLKLIDKGEYELTRTHYESMVEKLKKKYI